MEGKNLTPGNQNDAASQPRVCWVLWRLKSSHSNPCTFAHAGLAARDRRDRRGPGAPAHKICKVTAMLDPFVSSTVGLATLQCLTRCVCHCYVTFLDMLGPIPPARPPLACRAR
ncbi:hypothetical protein HaLaN_01049, partial [Haematococcus lacustris]